MASMTPEELQEMLDVASKPQERTEFPLGQNDVTIRTVYDGADPSKDGKIQLALICVNDAGDSGFVSVWNSGGGVPKFVVGLKALGFDNETILELLAIEDQDAFTAAVTSDAVLGARLSINVTKGTPTEKYPNPRNNVWLDGILPDEDEEDFAAEEGSTATSKAPEQPF